MFARKICRSGLLILNLSSGPWQVPQLGALSKRTFWNEVFWQVTIATGNTQSKFMGRYRSAKVIRVTGLKIERDPYWPEKRHWQLARCEPLTDTIR